MEKCTNTHLPTSQSGGEADIKSHCQVNSLTICDISSENSKAITRQARTIEAREMTERLPEIENDRRYQK